MRPILLAAALSVAACQAAPPRSAGEVVAHADLTLANVEQGYQDAKAFAAILTPFMSPATRARIAAAELMVDQALVAARAAVTLTARLTELRKAKAATDQINAATGVPADPAVPQT